MVRFLLFLLGCLFLGYPTESSPQATRRTFTIEELVPFRAEFYPESLHGNWVSDNELVFREVGVGKVKYNALTKTKENLLDESELLNLTSYSISEFSKDLKYVLLTSQEKKVYRYSRIAVYSVYNLQNKSITKVGDGPLQVVQWGQGQSLAFVKDNNVFYVPNVADPDVILTLTTEGVPGEVYFGAADWIYEEEILNAAEALWFSPDGASLAVAFFNDANVKSTSYPIYGNPFDLNNQYPTTMSFKYPKAGRVNPTVGVRVFKLRDSTRKVWDIPAPIGLIGTDHILGRVSWASDQNLLVLWLNRRQNISVLVNCDMLVNNCEIVQNQTEPNGWIDIHEPFFDSTGTQMLEINNVRSGDRRFSHATIYDLNTRTLVDMSPGNSTVTNIVGWNEATNTVYFIVAPSDVPWQRQLWSSTSGSLRCVSCQQPSCHSVEALFSPGASFGVLTCSSSSVPPKVFIYSAQDDSFKSLNDNSKLAKKLSQYELPMTLFNTISLGSGVLANIKLILPPVIEKGRRYPMVVRVYAGPGTTRVKDAFDLEYYNTYLASNRSYIIASIDVRGTKVMGVEAMHAVNNALGTVEVTDTLAAIRRLQALYQFIDGTRVGVWGWSYGGFTTTMMLAKDTQNTLACGAAVAPVSSWLYYDSIYTERYLDTPQNNPAGYHNSDLTLQSEALRGRRYLLVHGSGDDNVHFQHSMQLAKQLQHADILFEQVSYTDENHSLRGVSRHFYHTLDRFWTKCFNH